MTLCIDERFLTLKGRVPVFDENGQEKYVTHGTYVLGKDYFVEDMEGNELAHVFQKKISSTGTCYIERAGEIIGTIIPKITLVYPEYAVEGLDWKIKGNFTQSEFVITAKDREIVRTRVRIFERGSAFEIDIDDDADEVNALACVLAIEGLLETEVLGTAISPALNPVK